MKMKEFFSNISLKLKMSSGCLFFYSENNEFFLYYDNIDFYNLDVLYKVLEGLFNLLKDYPNTFLLFLTLFPIFKIYKRLNILFTNKFKKVGNNEDVLPMYKHTYNYLFFLGF
jgi:hypothetical protein